MSYLGSAIVFQDLFSFKSRIGIEICKIVQHSLVLDRMRFATLSSYNFLMPFQGAKALINPLNFLNLLKLSINNVL